MIKYCFKENFHLFYADGQLYDSNDVPVYTYENKTLILPEIELRHYGEYVGKVCKNFTLFLRQYDIYLGDEFVDSLNQQFTFFHHELSLDKLGWTIKGDIFALDYEIYDENDDLVAEINQELFRLTKRYYINIYDEDHEQLIILLMLAINQYDKDSDSSAAAASASSNH